MSTEIIGERGNVKISNDVLAKLAGYVATSCYGVVGMSARSSKDGIARLLKRENMNRGVKVKHENGKLNISLYVIAEYGVNVNTMGESIKNNVKYRMEEMTGMEVDSVIVNVESVRVD